jgi:hypothetical protein
MLIVSMRSIIERLRLHAEVKPAPGPAPVKPRESRD